MLEHFDAYHLYVPFTDFLIRLEIYSDKTVKQFEHLLNTSGVEQELFDMTKEFVAKVKAFHNALPHVTIEENER